MAICTTLAEIIEGYTGLSPAAFFTILALMALVYTTVSGMFVGPEEATTTTTQSHSDSAPILPPFSGSNVPNPSEPLQLGDVTEQQLRAYDGSHPNKPLLMAIKGHIYDVSTSRMFYGPGGPYALFAGRDASRALALLSFDPQDLTGNLEGLSESELEVLQDWEDKFKDKYVKVGQIV